MPNLAVALRQEIQRLARKEVRQQIAGTRKAATQYRHDIALLKRQLADMHRQLSQLEKRGDSRSEPHDNGGVTNGARFSPKGVKAHRARLGMSAADYGRLLGVSALTVYKWESGKARPRRQALAALVAARGIGKREAQRRLDAESR